MNLIIVESPHKSEVINRFLGKEYTVLASKGHIRDLASTGKMGLGVDIADNFKPTYFIPDDKKATVKELKAAVKKADTIYLATDPDREGEAIAWHLAQVLDLPVETTKRLDFEEITKSGITAALKTPRTIDMNLVKSQETRRIIDRIMGYRLSSLLQKKIKSRSAGRVQSVVLKLIVEKEKEIQAFKPEEYWTIDALLAASGNKEVKADLSAIQGKPVKQLDIKTEAEAQKILDALTPEFDVSSVKTEQKSKEPFPPFTMATMEQAAYSQFHFTTKRTAGIAQKLYEGEEIDGNSTGLITYMRTDSTRLSGEFTNAAFSFIQAEYGKEYVGHTHMQKANANTQDAHEAIRPTDLTLTPSKVKPFLSTDEYQLYSLIYARALSSLMKARVDEVESVVLTNGDYQFSCSTSHNVFEGYSKIYGKFETKSEVQELPELKEGDKLTLIKSEKTQHFTKAPARYNEGKVVKLMQDNGIGRPSTYAPTISALQDDKRKYVENQKGSLVPTEQGMLTSDKLEEYFPKYMDVKYTAEMENKLDEIASGNVKEKELLATFWDEFEKLFEEADKTMEKVKPVEVGRTCPKCGAPLVIRHGRFGDFVGCSNYPKCNYIEKEKPEVVEGKVCPKCGSPLVKRHSKKGDFLGCSNYPKCNYMEDKAGNAITREKKPVVIPEDAPLCPRCHKGHLIVKKSRWGKDFVGCSAFPKCHFMAKIVDPEHPFDHLEEEAAKPEKDK
ncbi:MAG: type I DNA topoisomerase [Bacilli bacterium]